MISVYRALITVFLLREAIAASIPETTGSQDVTEPHDVSIEPVIMDLVKETTGAVSTKEETNADKTTFPTTAEPASSETTKHLEEETGAVKSRVVSSRRKNQKALHSFIVEAPQQNLPPLPDTSEGEHIIVSGEGKRTDDSTKETTGAVSTKEDTNVDKTTLPSTAEPVGTETTKHLEEETGDVKSRVVSSRRKNQKALHSSIVEAPQQNLPPLPDSSEGEHIIGEGKSLDVSTKETTVAVSTKEDTNVDKTTLPTTAEPSTSETTKHLEEETGAVKSRVVSSRRKNQKALHSSIVEAPQQNLPPLPDSSEGKNQGEGKPLDVSTKETTVSTKEDTNADKTTLPTNAEPVSTETTKHLEEETGAVKSRVVYSRRKNQKALHSSMVEAPQQNLPPLPDSSEGKHIIGEGKPLDVSTKETTVSKKEDANVDNTALPTTAEPTSSETTKHLEEETGAVKSRVVYSSRKNQKALHSSIVKTPQQDVPHLPYSSSEGKNQVKETTGAVSTKEDTNADKTTAEPVGTETTKHLGGETGAVKSRVVYSRRKNQKALHSSIVGAQNLPHLPDSSEGKNQETTGVETMDSTEAKTIVPHIQNTSGSAKDFTEDLKMQIINCVASYTRNRTDLSPECEELIDSVGIAVEELLRAFKSFVSPGESYEGETELHTKNYKNLLHLAGHLLSDIIEENNKRENRTKEEDKAEFMEVFENFFETTMKHLPTNSSHMTFEYSGTNVSAQAHGHMEELNQNFELSDATRPQVNVLPAIIGIAAMKYFIY